MRGHAVVPNKVDTEGESIQTEKIIRYISHTWKYVQVFDIPYNRYA